LKRSPRLRADRQAAIIFANDVRTARLRGSVGRTTIGSEAIMGAFGGVVGLAGIATLLAAFFFESAAPGSRVANIDLMNFKLLLAVAGGSMLVAGAVLIGADEVRQAIRGLIPSASVVPRRDKIKGQSDD
jgi:hypothetical protein